MNNFDLSFLKYIQENNPLPVEDAIRRFGKTMSTLKRTMKEINALLPENVRLHQDNNFLTTGMGYGDYIALLQNIHFNRYITTADERVDDLFVALCLNDIVNKNDYYRKFYVSSGTVKNDNALMVDLVRRHGLVLLSIPRKGSQLSGDEFQLRVAVCMLILKTVEIGKNNQLIAHKANEPISRSIAEQFFTKCATQITTAAKLYETVVYPKLALSYNGKKYFLVYLSVAMYRQARGWMLNNTDAASFITTYPWHIFADAKENAFIDLLISSLTFTSKPFTLYDARLVADVKKFCKRVADVLKSPIHNQSDYFAEIYQFLFAAIIQNKFHLWFDDKKLHDVKSYSPELWQHVKYALSELAITWQVTFSSVHLATLVLIIKKYELQNRLVSEPKKRVVIVTNSSESKVGYFKEVLRSWFHIEITDCVNINEIERLQHQSFDLLITFTNKISSYLKYYQYEYVKVNFHLAPDDITLLRQHGLSRARKKISAEDVARQVQGMDTVALARFLETQYPDHFI